MIHFVNVPITLDASAGEDAPKTITGIAVPWAPASATVSDGTKVSFSRGAFDLNMKAPKLLENHDMGQLRGVVSSLADFEEGLGFTATFAKTGAAADAIELVKAGAYDSVSVGAVPTKFKYDKNGVMVVSKADLIEISLVAQPAFKEAQITEIAASEPEEDATEPTPTDSEEEPEVATQENPVVEVEASIIPTTPIYATAKRTFVMPTAAEYISAAFVGGDKWREMSAGIQAAAPDVVTSDIPGVLPLPIVQPVYNNFIGRRPVIDAIGAKAMPQGGKVFIRPEVTTHTSIGNQATENTSLTQGTFVVTDNQVTKGSYGGFVTLSEQSIDWSQPEIIGLVLDDMARIYANETDNVAADNLKTGATVTRNFALASVLDASYWATWISGAAQTILSSSNGNLPTHIFVNPEWWGFLLSLSDTSKRPLFPQIGPMNAFGNLAPGQVNGVAFGLQVVVDRNFAADTLIVGDASGYEIFEQQKGALSIDVPSTMSRTIAFRGYLATLMIDSSKFVKMAPVG
jgi:HK97 family phage prohead protease